MTDKELGDIIKQKLEEYKPEYDPASWEALESRLDASDELVDDAFDQSVRTAFAGFALPEDAASDWESMEKILDADQGQQFDDTIRSSMEKFEEPYDSSSWPVLDTKIDEDEKLRRRLIAAKVLEVAAVLLIILTLHNLMPDIKELVFPNIEDTQVPGTEQTAEVLTVHGSEAGILSTNSQTTEIAGDLNQEASSIENTTETKLQSTIPYRGEAVLVTEGRDLVTTDALAPVEANGFDLISLTDAQECEVTPDLGVAMIGLPPAIASLPMGEPVHSSNTNLIPPTPKPFSARRSLKLTLAASADVNSLYMPDEQFYIGGQKIRFNERTLAALGFSTGAGLVFGYGAWSFETGLYYSSKQFEPNRVLQIGKAFDVRTLDFERISLHVISVPLKAHWLRF